MTTATFRLDPGLAAALERLADKRGQTKSELLRDALESFLRTENENRGEDEPVSALDRLRPYVGIAPSGHGSLSRKTGERFHQMLQERQMLREKHRSRRSD